jgi:hypothetical protein
MLISMSWLIPVFTYTLAATLVYPVWLTASEVLLISDQNQTWGFQFLLCWNENRRFSIKFKNRPTLESARALSSSRISCGGDLVSGPNLLTSGIGPLYEVPIYRDLISGRRIRANWKSSKRGRAFSHSLVCLGEAFLPGIDFSAVYSRLLWELITPGSIAYAGLNKIAGSFLGSQQEVVWIEGFGVNGVRETQSKTQRRGGGERG